MGYTATWDGKITVRRDAAHVDPILEKYSGLGSNGTYAIGNDQYLYFGSGGENYRDDEWYAFLGEITPFTKEGEVEFAGEDNTFWCFRFDRKTGRWRELNGHVEYDETDREVVIHPRDEEMRAMAADLLAKSCGKSAADVLLTDEFFGAVFEDVRATSDYEKGNYNEDDVRLAIGRVLVHMADAARLGREMNKSNV